MSAQTTKVRIHRQYVLKVMKKGMTYEHLGLIQLAIEQGYCFRGKRDYLEFVFFDQAGLGDEYLLVLKSARWGQEVWFVTFHRTNLQQYRSKMRKLSLLRSPEGAATAL